jgi:hypothetical protein
VDKVVFEDSRSGTTWSYRAVRMNADGSLTIELRTSAPRASRIGLLTKGGVHL